MITRNIKKIIVHCADTKVNQNFDIKDVDQWHKQRGFSMVGYHYYIKLDGTIQEGRNLEQVGAHCKGQNSDSIGICFEGGKNADGSKWDSPLSAQLDAWHTLYQYLCLMFGNLPLKGHYEYSEKSCPNFEIDDYLW